MDGTSPPRDDERPLWMMSRAASMSSLHVRYIANHMRARDLMEIFATRWEEPAPKTLEAFAREVCRTASFMFIFGRDRPIAVVGAVQSWPGTYSVFAFATDEFPRVVLSISRFVRLTMIPMLVRHGARRAQAVSHAKHTSAHRWLRILGAEHESTLTAFGKDGCNFEVYRWLRPAGS
jgi:hypothetical protein